MIGIGCRELVDNNNTFDHVAKDGDKGSITQCNSNDTTALAATHGAIDPDNSRRAAKTRRK